MLWFYFTATWCSRLLCLQWASRQFGFGNTTSAWLDVSDLDTVISPRRLGFLVPRCWMGCCLTLRNKSVQGNTPADRARDFIGKGRLGREQQSRSPVRELLLPRDKLSGFMVIGLALDIFWPISLMQGPSWCTCMHCSAKMDASKEDSGRC